MTYAQAATSYETVTAGWPTGLVGTIGVRVLDNVGGTATPRVTAGIIESPAGSGIYAKTLTAPAPLGQYTILWDDGSTSPGHTATDDLVVTAQAPQPPVVDPALNLNALSSVAAAREHVLSDALNTSQDSKLIRFINWASTAIWNLRRLDREFTPSNGVSRRLFYDGAGFLSLSPYELRALTAISLYSDEATPQTLAAGDYRLEPRERTREGTYLSLELLTAVRPRGAVTRGYEVMVAGDWGMLSVPADVEGACLIMVADLYRNPAGFATVQMGPYSATEELQVSTVPVGGVPPAARRLLEPYMRKKGLGTISLSSAW